MSRSLPPTPEPASVNERLIARLNALPSVIPVLGVLALIAAGALLPGYGCICTAVVVLFLGWMLSVSWARLTGVERLMRVAVIALLAAITIIQLRPRA